MSEQEHQKKPKEHSQPTIEQPDIPNALLPPADKHIFDAFDIKKEPWKQYMERLKQHFTMCKITDAEQQRECLLSYIGSETYELLRKLFGLKDITNKTFKTLVSKLSDHFEIPKHIQAARHKFYNCKMKPNQSHSDWVADLRTLSHECEFLCKNGHCNESYADNQIRDMIIKETAFVIFTSGPSSPELTNQVATSGHSFSNATFTQRTGEQAKELVIIDSPAATEDFDDSAYADASETVDEDVSFPQTLHEFSSDDEQTQPKEVSAIKESSMLPMTIPNKNATTKHLNRKKNSDLMLDCSKKSLLAAHVITLQSPEDDDGNTFESSTTSPEGEKDDLQFELNEDEQVYSAAATLIIAPAEMYVTAPISINLKKSEGDSPMLPTTLADNDLPEDATNVRDQDKFWHYNKLIKGPKPRVTFDVDVTHAEENPHNPIVFQDPVYDKSQPSFVQHPGRARVGEGNDITPNPGKLIKLGNDLKEVQMKMAALGDARKNKREKMRLSSRLGRLKKSANHEANKIKLFGLEQERVELCSVIAKVKDKMKIPSPSEESYFTYLQQSKTERLKTKVAGQTGEYVNSVLEASKSPTYFASDSD